MKPITLTDLDGVHFQSRGHSPLNVDLLTAAVDTSALPSSFMTPKQSAFLSWLLAESEVVPVTARDVESYKRVLVSFHGYAICSFGGVILTPEGVPEPRWHEHISSQSKRCKPKLAAYKKVIARAIQGLQVAVRVTVIKDVGCDLYLNCKHESENETELTLLAAALITQLPPAWVLHLNGNNLAVLPPFLGKRQAADFYLSELAPPHSCVLGLGDSYTDLEFLTLCDYAAAPTNSQIFSLLKLLAQNSKGVGT